MSVVTMELDTSCLSQEELASCLADGVVVEATAILNRRWDDFSAVPFLESLNFQSIREDVVEDETPGSLWLTVIYPDLSSDAVAKRFEGREAVNDWYYADVG